MRRLVNKTHARLDMSFDELSADISLLTELRTSKSPSGRENGYD
jgi:hypothetical protein